MAALEYVEGLSRSYLSKGEESRCWSDYLKAHGLANYLVALDPTDERYQLVYDVEKSWYEGKHPLTHSQHRDLIERHKQLVQDYRDRIVEEFVNIEVKEKSLRSDEIFSESNMQRLQEFSEDVLKISKLCSDELISVSSEIFLSCVQNLMAIGLVAPCHFTVLGLGSVAKGEATPYSDLEYAIIVESEDEYFTSLAVESYFRIGNLCESPLGTFDIAELVDCNLPLADLPTAGFRIDGIKPKAGNIPTGRVGGQKLILTVDGFMELYKKSAEEPFTGLADKSDMLSSSVQIYSRQGDNSTLYTDLQQAIAEYENARATSNVFINRKRLHLFSVDVENFNDLPGHSPDHRAASVSMNVKEHIFRYVTLLANNIRVCMAFGPSLPWETFAKLKSSGLLSQLNHSYLQIVLALSIYIRTKAYITQKTQCKTVSLYTASTHDKHMFHVPRTLFVTLGCLVIPVKHSIRYKLKQCYHSINNGADIKHIIGLLTRSIVVDETDFMLKVELFHFIEENDKSLHELERAVGGDIEGVGFVGFLQKLRSIYRTTKSDKLEYKHIELSCHVLYRSDKNQAALDFFNWFVTYQTSPGDTAACKVHTADIMIALDKAKGAKTLLNQAIRLCKQELGLGLEQDFLQYLRYKMSQDEEQPPKTKSVTLGEERAKTLIIYLLVIKAHDAIGQACYNRQLCQFDESLQSLTYALSLCKLLLCWYTKPTDQLSELPVLDIESIDCDSMLGDLSTFTAQDRMCYCTLGGIYKSLQELYQCIGNPQKALHCATTFFKVQNHLLGNTNHPDIAAALATIARAHAELGNYTVALEYYTRCLDMQDALHGASTSHHSHMVMYNSIAGVHSLVGNNKVAMEYMSKALAIAKNLHGTETNHSDIAMCYVQIAVIHYGMGEYAAALEFGNKALDMMIALYGADSNHLAIPNVLHTIASVHIALGDYIGALSAYKRALAIFKNIYGVDGNHSSIAASYGHIGVVHRNLGDYAKALEYHTKALAMYKAIYGDDVIHRDISVIYVHFGGTHRALGNYVNSVVSYVKSLEICTALSATSRISRDIAELYIELGDVYELVNDDSNASKCYTQALIVSVNISRSDLISKALLSLSSLLCYQLSYKLAVQFLQIGQKKAGSDIDLQVRVLFLMGNCYIKVHNWRKAWLCLYTALSTCQSLSSCKRSLLAEVHLSIGQLLLHLGYISHSLEHSQLALDITSKLLARNTSREYITLDRYVRLLSDSLHLVKICQHQFHEFKLTPEPSRVFTDIAHGASPSKRPTFF